MRNPLWRSVAYLLACHPLVAMAEDRVGVVTLLEGPATLVRGVTRHALAEGVRFHPGDIVVVGDKGLVEIEYPDGPALAMGPGTHVLAIASSRGKIARGDFYVTRGALKLSRVKKGASFRFQTPLLVLQPLEGATVFVLGAADGAIFVEGGAAQVLELMPKGPSRTVSLKSGDFYTRKEDQKSAIAQRPSQAFIAALPRSFIDSLPSRLARFKAREVQPRRIDEVSYEDVEEWLQAPRDIRRPLMPRFRPRVRDAAFRAELVKNLRHHPEWDPILFPEKYEPRDPRPDATGAAPAGVQQR